LRESAILALLRLESKDRPAGDSTWWRAARQAITRYVDEDPHVSAEVLLALLDIDSEHADFLAAPHRDRPGELGVAARRVHLAAALRREFPKEVLPPCV